MQLVYSLLQLDSVSHRVLTSVNDPAAGKKYEHCSYDAIMINKLTNEYIDYDI